MELTVEIPHIACPKNSCPVVYVVPFATGRCIVAGLLEADSTVHLYPLNTPFPKNGERRPWAGVTVAYAFGWLKKVPYFTDHKAHCQKAG